MTLQLLWVYDWPARGGCIADAAGEVPFQMNLYRRERYQKIKAFNKRREIAVPAVTIEAWFRVVPGTRLET
jgi:hypothetical protein